MKVAVVQPKIGLGRKESNLRSIARAAISLSKLEVDLACFPELVTTGYALYERWPKVAEEIPGPTTNLLAKASREAGMYLVVGMPERKGAAIFDSAVLSNPSGDVEGVYRKVHLWDKERVYFTRGDRFSTFKIRHGKIGIGICYDIEFPEAARTMAVDGASLLLFPSAQPKNMTRRLPIYAKSRASENCAFVACANLVGNEADLTYLGRSLITSPDCEILADVRSQPGSAVAELDFNDLESFRKELPYLEQRVPSTYK